VSFERRITLVFVLIVAGAAGAMALLGSGPPDEAPPPTLLPLQPAGESGDPGEDLRRELEEAARLARQQAEEEFPPLSGGSGVVSAGPSPERERRLRQKREELAEAIESKYRARIAERRGLSLAELEELIAGGGRGSTPASAEPTPAEPAAAKKKGSGS
jgi:hypothetical protein